MEGVFGFPSFPPFQLGQPRFPQSSFLGRYLHFLDVIDPRTLLASQAELDSSVSLLRRWKENERGFASDEALWRAQKLTQATLHPDTGEKILPPFRMAGYVPFGWITVTGMLLPAPSVPTILFWQWANQSHNALVNYANRNATKETPVSTLLTAYSCAVGAACTVSLGLTKLLKTFTSLPAHRQLFLQRFVPLPATSLASSLNVLCMRGREIYTGIDVYERNGRIVGTSKAAAKKAVLETTATRAFLPVPLLLLPPLIMPFFERISWCRPKTLPHLLVNASVCTLSFAFSLPIALALFPQESSISLHSLEPELQAETKETTLYFNKGL